MKFKSFATGLIGLLMVGSLFSCGKDEHKIHLDNPKDYIDANLVEKDKEENEPLLPIKYFNSYSLSNYEVVSTEHASNGIVVLKNKGGFIGFYSISHCKFIVNCQFYYEWLDYKIVDNVVGTFISIDYEDNQYIYDNNGNLLYRGTFLTNDGLYWTAEGFLRNGIHYVTISTQYENLSYKYNADGTVTKVYTIPEEVIQDEELEENTYEQGDLFKDDETIDMSEFGLADHYLQCTSRGLTTLFSSRNEPLQTFNVPNNSTPILTGSSIFYQKTYPLADDNENFAYYENNMKYALSTYKIDLLSGVETEIEFNYLIDDVVPFKDDQGLYKYSLVDMRRINEFKVLDDTITHLLDYKLNKVGDFTGIQPQSFIKLTNGNYFNLDTKIIYDENLNAITYLEDMNPIYYESKGLFIGEKNGYKGAVDESGRVVLPFEFNNIYIHEERPNALLVNKDGTVVYYDAKHQSEIETYQASSLRVIDHKQGLFAIEDDVSIKFLDLNECLYTADNYNELSYYNSFLSNPGNDCETMHIGYLTKNYSLKYFTFVYGTSNVSFNSIGTTETVTPNTGRNFEDAILIKEGTQKIHANPTGSSTYVKVENPTSGFYQAYDVDHENYREVNSIYVENGDGEIRPYRNDLYTDFFLLSDYNYYFELDINGYVSFSLNLETEVPDILASESFTALPDKSLYRLIRTNENGGYYKFDTQNLLFDIYEYGETNDLFEFHVTFYEYDGGYVTYLDSNSTYLIRFYEQGGTGECSYNFNLYKDVITPYESDEEITIAPHTHVLRKITPTENINLRFDNYLSEVYYVDTSLKRVTKYGQDNNYIVSLEANKTYYIDLKNNQSEEAITKIEEFGEVLHLESIKGLNDGDNLSRTFDLTEGTSNYYFFKLDGLKVDVYRRSGTYYSSIYPNRYNYDEGTIMYLDGGYQYLFIFTVEDTLNEIDEQYLFDIYKNQIKENNGVEKVELGDSYVLRKFIPNTDGKYMFSTVSLGNAFYYDTSSYKSVLSYNRYYGYGVSNLIAGNTYYFEYKNSSTEPINIEIFTLEYNYENLPVVNFEKTEYDYLPYGIRYLKKIDPTTSFNAYIESESSCPVTIRLLNADNTLSNLTMKPLNGKTVYTLEKGQKYIVYYYSNYSSYSFRFKKIDADNVPSLGVKNLQITGDYAYQYTPDKTGYYSLSSTLSSTNQNIYKLDAKTNSYVKVEKETEKNLYYQLNANEKYIIYSHDAFNSRYYINLIYVTDDLKTMPSHVINPNTFSYDIATKSFTSTNHNGDSKSSMIITISGNGTLSFNYEVASEAGYDLLTIYVDGTVYRTKSGTEASTLMMDVKSGQTIEIAYTKDSGGNVGTDNVVISNLSFNPTPAQA